MSESTATETSVAAWLRNRLDEIEAIKRDVRELLDGLTDTQVRWRPDARGWSIAECLDHIVLAGEPYLPRIEQMVAEAKTRSERRQPPLRPGMFAGWFVRSMEPPPRLRMKTFHAMEPGSPRAVAEVQSSFLALYDRLAQLLRSANGAAPHGARTTSPFLRLLRLTLDQAVGLLTAHARRHLWQARQVRHRPGFPQA